MTRNTVMHCLVGTSVILSGFLLSADAVAQTAQNTWHTGKISSIVVGNVSTVFKFVAGGPSTCTCSYLGADRMCVDANMSTRKTQDALLLTAKATDATVGAVVNAQCVVQELHLNP